MKVGLIWERKSRGVINAGRDTARNVVCYCIGGQIVSKVFGETFMSGDDVQFARLLMRNII